MVKPRLMAEIVPFDCAQGAILMLVEMLVERSRNKRYRGCHAKPFADSCILPPRLGQSKKAQSAQRLGLELWV